MSCIAALELGVDILATCTLALTGDGYFIRVPVGPINACSAKRGCKVAVGASIQRASHDFAASRLVSPDSPLPQPLCPFALPLFLIFAERKIHVDTTIFDHVAGGTYTDVPSTDAAISGGVHTDTFRYVSPSLSD